MNTDNREETYLLMGFPASGKTTFLAAFTALLNAYADRMMLQKREYKSFSGFNENLQKQAQKWSGFETVDRTIKNVEEDVVLELVDKNGQAYTIEIPDVSGEIYDDMLSKRFADSNIQSKICKADIILFFMNLANSRDDAKLITQLPQQMQELLDIPDDNEKNIQMSDYEEMLFQSKVVELLQILQYIKQNSINVKFLLSAWDVVELLKGDDKKTPVQIMQEEFPMIFQFIENNSGWLSSEIWGVSAQGCDLSTPDEIVRLSQLEDQIDRVMVVNSLGEISNDLSEIFIYKEEKNEE